MTEQEQRIALAEWMGWRLDAASPTTGRHGTIRFTTLVHSPTGGKEVFDSIAEAIEALPDTNSLDVLHEIEMKLNCEQRNSYIHRLWELLGPNWSYCEVALMNSAQRREALCRALGLWKD